MVTPDSTSGYESRSASVHTGGLNVKQFAGSSPSSGPANAAPGRGPGAKPLTPLSTLDAIAPPACSDVPVLIGSAPGLLGEGLHPAVTSMAARTTGKRRLIGTSTSTQPYSSKERSVFG